MKLQFVVLGCLACGLATVYASPYSDETDSLVHQIGKYPSLVNAIQKLVKYVISKESIPVQNEANQKRGLNNDPNEYHMTYSDGDNESDESHTLGESESDETRTLEDNKSEDSHTLEDDEGDETRTLEDSESDEIRMLEDNENDESYTLQDSESDETRTLEDNVSNNSHTLEDDESDKMRTLEDSESDETRTLEDNDEDASSDREPYLMKDRKLIGGCMQLPHLLRENCYNRRLLAQATDKLAELKGGIADKTDFEISVYAAAVDEFFRSSKLASSVSVDKRYKNALLTTLQTYYQNTTGRIQHANETVSLVKDGLKQLDKKVNLECSTKGVERSPGIECDQVVLKWYRGVIKVCPEFKNVMRLHIALKSLGNEYQLVESELAAMINKETAPRTFALTQKKYHKLLTQGMVVFELVAKARSANSKCLLIL